MIYRLKIESSIHEVPDILSAPMTSLSIAVSNAELHKGRVWILNDESRIVAVWTGVSWQTTAFWSGF